MPVSGSSPVTWLRHTWAPVQVRQVCCLWCVSCMFGVWWACDLVRPVCDEDALWCDLWASRISDEALMMRGSRHCNLRICFCWVLFVCLRVSCMLFVCLRVSGVSFVGLRVSGVWFVCLRVSGVSFVCLILPVGSCGFLVYVRWKKKLSVW